MKYIVVVRPNPDSELRLQGEADSLLGAMEALIRTVNEFGSDDLLARIGIEFAAIQDRALYVEGLHPTEDLRTLLREFFELQRGGL